MTPVVRRAHVEIMVCNSDYGSNERPFAPINASPVVVYTLGWPAWWPTVSSVNGLGSATYSIAFPSTWICSQRPWALSSPWEKFQNWWLLAERSFALGKALGTGVVSSP